MPKPPRLCTACGKVHHVDMPCRQQREQERIRKARHDRVRPIATSRGYDAEWRRLSKLFLSRPENAYCTCGRPATLVRHRISIRKRPDLRLDRRNWLPGCAKCNAEDRKRELAADQLGGAPVAQAVVGQAQNRAAPIPSSIARAHQKVSRGRIKEIGAPDPRETLKQLERPLRKLMLDHSTLHSELPKHSPSIAIGQGQCRTKSHFSISRTRVLP